MFIDFGLLWSWKPWSACVPECLEICPWCVIMAPKFRHKSEGSACLGNRWWKWDQDQASPPRGENSLRQPPVLGHSRKPSLGQCFSCLFLFLDHHRIISYWSLAQKTIWKSHPPYLLNTPIVWSQWNVEIPDKKPWFRLGVSHNSNRTVGMSAVWPLWVGKVVEKTGWKPTEDRGWDWCAYYWGFVSHHQNKYLLEIVSPIGGWCETLGHQSQPLEDQLKSTVISSPKGYRYHSAAHFS